MSHEEINAGVMDGSYARDRRKSLPLQFRYEVRSLLAVQAFQRRQEPQDRYRVLDLGAAEGRTLLRIRELLGGRGEFRGIELSDELLAEAPPLPEGVELLRGNVMALPEALEEGSYDLCTALAVLEHLPDPVATLKEAHRMLRPGGVFVATCPHPLWDDIAGKLHMVEEEAHEQELGKAEMLQMAREAGFDRITYEPFMWVPVGTLPYLGVRVAAGLALRIDQLVRRARLLGFSFVNQALVASKA